MMKMRTTAISLTEDQYQQVLNESKKTGVSMAGLIRLALVEYFKEATK